jgi:hypothetical protein
MSNKANAVSVNPEDKATRNKDIHLLISASKDGKIFKSLIMR